MLVLAVVAFIVSTVLTIVVRSVGGSASGRRAWDLRHGADTTVPRIGGLAVALALALIGAAASVLGIGGEAVPSLSGASPWLVTSALALVFIVGVADDLVHVSARVKFGAQIGAALLAISGGVLIESVDLPFAGLVHLPAVLSGALTLLWLVGVTNAFNLVDGIDGLASGLAIVTLGATSGVASSNGHNGVAIAALLVGAATAGFYVHNVSPKRIFLGDGGAFLLGLAVAILSLMAVRRGDEGPFVFHAAWLLCAVPILDVLLVMVRRALSGRSIFSADRRHLHHQLIDAGLGSPTARQVLLMFQAILATSGATVLAVGLLPALGLSVALTSLLAVGLSLSAPTSYAAVRGLFLYHLRAPNHTLARWKVVRDTIHRIDAARSAGDLQGAVLSALEGTGCTQVQLTVAQGPKRSGPMQIAPEVPPPRRLILPVLGTDGRELGQLHLESEGPGGLDLTQIGLRLDSIAPAIASRLRRSPLDSADAALTARSLAPGA